MLFPGRIYITLGPKNFGDFRKIFLPNIGEDKKKVSLSEREALALRHRINTAVVVALRL